jgi:hypothetical protein
VNRESSAGPLANRTGAIRQGVGGFFATWHEEDQGLAGDPEDVDGQTGRRRGLADEPGELDAAHGIGADLLDIDAPAGELGGEEVAGVAQAATRDDLALGVGVGARRQADRRLGAGTPGGGQDSGDEPGSQGDRHAASSWHDTGTGDVVTYK